MPIQATQHIQKMRGGAQSHMMRADDGFFYIVKFQNNPQHLRVLANEYLATKLAGRIGLAVPHVEVVEVSPWTVDHSDDLTIEIAGQKKRCCSGLQCGSRFVVDPMAGEIFCYLEEPLSLRCRNVEEFAGALAFDKWTCNADGRQAAFWKFNREKKYKACFIDQGYCFNAGEWRFEDAPLRGVFLRNDAYTGVTGWNSFEPWLSNLETLELNEIARYAEEIPPEWYDNNWEAMETLVTTTYRRRSMVRRLIDEFRMSSRRPFPNWGVPMAAAAPRQVFGFIKPPDKDIRRWN